MAHNNGLTEHTIYGLRNKPISKKDRTKQTQATLQYIKKWVIFAHHISAIHKLTNTFK